MHVNNVEKKEGDAYNWEWMEIKAVQNMWGTKGFLNLLGFYDQLRLREQIKQGKLRGPYIYTAGPVLWKNLTRWTSIRR